MRRTALYRPTLCEPPFDVRGNGINHPHPFTRSAKLRGESPRQLQRLRSIASVKVDSVYSSEK